MAGRLVLKESRHASACEKKVRNKLKDDESGTKNRSKNLIKALFGKLLDVLTSRRIRKNAGGKNEPRSRVEMQECTSTVQMKKSKGSGGFSRGISSSFF